MQPDEPERDLKMPTVPRLIVREAPLRPLPNYSLASECPACGETTFRHACKVRCPRCGFAWDCSEL